MIRMPLRYSVWITTKRCILFETLQKLESNPYLSYSDAISTAHAQPAYHYVVRTEGLTDSFLTVEAVGLDVRHGVVALGFFTK
jgi:hypothetical protein